MGSHLLLPQGLASEDFLPTPSRAPRAPHRCPTAPVSPARLEISSWHLLLPLFPARKKALWSISRADIDGHLTASPAPRVVFLTQSPQFTFQPLLCTPGRGQAPAKPPGFVPDSFRVLTFHRLGASTSGLHPDGILRPAQQRVRSHQGSGKAAPPACLALRTPSLARRRRYHHHSDRSGGDKEASRDLSSRAGPGAWRWPWPHCGVCPAIS
nr:PREDICTED: uncharacterized protein LOC103565597 [Equus przewalskii]